MGDLSHQRQPQEAGRATVSPWPVVLVWVPQHDGLASVAQQVAALAWSQHAAGLVAWMIAACICGSASWVNRTDASTNPAVASPSRYSCFDRAPAMQPENDPRAARSASVSWSSATTSLIPIRPPGVSTQNISASTRGLSPDRLTTQLEMTTSTEASVSGKSSIWAL